MDLMFQPIPSSIVRIGSKIWLRPNLNTLINGMDNQAEDFLILSFDKQGGQNVHDSNGKVE